MTLENVGERNHSDASCPGVNCNQVIAAGPFNCTKYVKGSFVMEEGSMGYYTDYKCAELPGIGSEAYDLQILSTACLPRQSPLRGRAIVLSRLLLPPSRPL